MKKYRAMKAAACAMALSAALTVGASAATNVTATMRPDVTVRIDGIARDFYNAQGKEVHPILYNGTTYIPLRAIGELMGKNVNWDQATGTASIGGTRTTGTVSGTPDTNAKRADVTFTLRPEYHIVIDGTERTFVNVNGEKVDPAICNGSIYLPIRAIGEIMGKQVSWDGTTNTVLLDSVSGGDVTDFDTNNPSSGTTTPGTTTGSVTLEQAKQTALTHAGKTAAQVQFVKAQQDWEHGRQVYEIEFIVSSGNGYTEYDYEIDAATGKIVSYDYDAESYTPPAQNTTPGANTAVKVSEASAKQTALARVPGATAANIYKFKLDFDDGRWEYEGEIRYGAYEYDFTIDATTGVITEWDVDPIYD